MPNYLLIIKTISIYIWHAVNSLLKVTLHEQKQEEKYFIL